MSSRRSELPQKLRSGDRLPRAGRACPLLLDGYVRVSYPGRRRGERFLSPQLQEQSIRTWATAHGATIGHIFVELGRSGTDPSRPELAALLARLEAGTSNGVIVARLDRLGRGVAQTLQLLGQIDAGGASFISIEDGFDSSTPLGRALMTILLALSELELGRLSDSTRTGRERAVRRGAHPCTRPPPGYRRALGGRLEPDDQQAPLIAAAYTRRAAGATYAELAAFLTDAGLPPPPAGSWTGARVYRLFQSPVYLGEAFSGSVRNLDAHPALVRRGLWLAAHAASARAFADARGQALLTGIVRCGSCGHPLRHWSSQAKTPSEPRARPRTYRCRKHFPDGDCDAPAAADGELLERAVVDRCLRGLAGRRGDDEFEHRLTAAEEALGRIEARVTTHREWRSAVDDTPERDVAHARAAVLALWRQLQRAKLPPPAELRRSWPSLSHRERRQTLETALDGVLLRPGTAAVEQRVRLVNAGSRTSRTGWPHLASRNDQTQRRPS